MSELHYETASHIAFFLISQGKKSYEEWDGYMPAKKQREVFGVYLGRGRIFVDGLNETISMTVKVCFGLDFNTEINIDCKDPQSSYASAQYKEAREFVNRLKGVVV